MFYFITGEEITRRVELLQPRRPYAPRGVGPGAVELFARFANLELGNNVFTSGLVNPAEWSNRANVTDLGVNWYLHHYVKITLDWQYSDFGKPVYLAAGKMTRFENLFWFRTQVFF
jgi:phosphate-selective porin OprO/OprP